MTKHAARTVRKPRVMELTPAEFQLGIERGYEAAHAMSRTQTSLMGRTVVRLHQENQRMYEAFAWYATIYGHASVEDAITYALNQKE